MTSSPLLPLSRDFIGRLAGVRALAYPFFRGIYPRTALSGPPSEFDGHRPDLPGDDTRWIDWNLFARLEELYVKVFQVEEEVEVVILLDGSLSMTARPGSKYHTAAACAAALFYLAVLTAHPATVVRYADRVLDSRGPYRNLQGFAAMTELLRAPPRGEGTDLRQALGPFLVRRRRAVTLVAVTDGFQREPIEGIARSLTEAPNRRFVLLRILQQADLRPRVRGNVLLRDLEGGGQSAVLSDGALEKQLRSRIAARFRDMDESLRSGRADSFTLPVEGSFEDEFLGVLMRSAPPAVTVPESAAP